MSFVERLKAAVNKPSEPDFVDKIQRDPKYAKIISKLESLDEERRLLTKDLAKVELDIDTCLVLIETERQRQELERGE
jgi:hypothetical protein